MSDLIHIGTIELIDLPKVGNEGVFGVPAKIDTGADSSSIWASNIVERDGRLTFTLFGEGSTSYSGQTIEVASFKVTRVRNSFGVAESRYKVPLTVILGGKRISAQFTLANRANNRYPVLIGRRTLRGRFLVDVSRRLAKDSIEVLMLSTKRTTVTQKFADNIASHDERLHVTYASYADLDYSMGMPDSQITLRSKGRDIASFDMVYFKTTSRYMDVAAATARYLERRRVSFIDEAIKHFPATSKLYQYLLLEHSPMRVPPSFFALAEALPGLYGPIKERLGLPFVLKDIHGNKGLHNYVVRDQASFDAACAEAAKDGVQCVAQAFVPNDCDYRVLVFGKKIALVIKRTRQDDSTHLNNTSQGAKAEVVAVDSLPVELRQACVRAARLVERNIAGVDIVRDKKTGVWYCLEVNDGPQLASGSFTAEKHAAIADYLMRKLA